MAEVTPKDQEITGDRNPDGTFKSGVSGNPAGRPEGTVSLTTLVRSKLREIPLGQVKSYAEQLVDKIISKAVVDGNDVMLKEIWHYMDGMPKNTVSIDADKESIEKLTDFFKAAAAAKPESVIPAINANADESSGSNSV